MTNEQPPVFDDVFDQDGELKPTVTRADLGPDDFRDPLRATPTHIINNTNQQTGAEFNVFFKNNADFKCHLKLHGPTGKAVLEQSAGALAYLAAHDFTPEHVPAPAVTTEPTRQDLPQDGTASASFCTIHNCEMKRREKDGQVWYSHKITGTEDWCRGQQ